MLSFLCPHGSPFTMKKAGFRSLDTRSLSGWLKWLFVGVSIITSNAPVFGQGQESLADQGFTSNPLSEVRNAREATRTLYPARAQQLDLGSFSTREQEHIRELLRATTANYTGIARDVRLRRSNWALVKQEDGLDVWQVHIRSPSAVKLWLHFLDFHLEPGMSVNVYALAGDGHEWVTEYTGRGLSRDGGDFMAFPTSGDTVVIEFWVPDSYHLEPGDFPFSVGKVSHTFKDNNGVLHGEGIKRLAPRKKADSCERANLYYELFDNNNIYVAGDSPAYVLDASKGVVSICYSTWFGLGISNCGSGSFIKNKSGDGAPYILTANHLFEPLDIGTDDTGRFIPAFFGIPGGSYAFGAKYVTGKGRKAGDEGGDWAIIRLDGTFIGSGDYKLLGWTTRTTDTFSGYSVHHAGARPQQWNEYVKAEAHPYPYWTFRGSPSFCEGAVCGYMQLTYKDISPTHGASGSTSLYKKTGLITGVQNTGPVGVPGKECLVYGYGMGAIYENEIAFNILNYGDAYFHGSQFPYMDPELACSFSSQAMAGSGTESDPYQVENICHLRDMEASPQSHYVQVKDMDAATMTHGWKNGFTPIKDFSGTFDGNGYRISNLKVNIAGEEFENIGLFGKLQGGLLKRVKLVNVLTKVGVNVGSLVGLNDRGTIEDSEVDGKVDGYRTIGGLVGLNQGGVIRNSKATVRVGENSSNTFVAGGLVGQNDGGTVEGSRALGAVTGGNQVGGLVGKNMGSVTSSHATGNVTGTHAIGGYVGGLVGWHLGGTISGGSFVHGQVVGAGSGTGGLVGLNDRNASIVNGHVGVSARVSGKSEVGGLVGRNAGSISDSHVYGRVTGDSQVGGLVGVSEVNASIVNSQTREYGRVFGKNQVGGLVGRNAGSINSSHMLGHVYGNSFVGGLVGVNEVNASIVNSHISVKAYSHTGVEARVSGKNRVGGLVGENKGSISGSHAQGRVTGDSQIGGLVGVSEVNASIVNSHTHRDAHVGGKNQIGGLVGENKGSISGSHAQGRVTGDSQVGGLAGVSEVNASIVNSRMDVSARVTGKNQVGGLVGENKGAISGSHARGAVSGVSQVGGLVGENKGSISDSYAQGTVSGDRQAGGLVGENSGLVRSAYSTGAVAGANFPGRLAGVNSGTIAHSYASRLGDGDSLVGVNDGAVQDSGLRAVEQMECSMTPPVNLCREAGVYLDWDTRIWHFGHSRMLPVLRAVTDVPAAPLAVRAGWNWKGRWTLQWEHRGAAVNFFEVEVDGIIRDTRASRFTFDSTLMAELRGRYAGGSEIHYSIRSIRGGVAGDAASGSFHLMKVPGVVETRIASGLSTVRVTIVGAAGDGYGRAPGSSMYGKPAGEIALDLAYHVRLFSKGLLKEERRMTQQGSSNSTVVEFSGLEGGSRYEVRIFAENKMGAGQRWKRRFSPTLRRVRGQR